MTNPYQNIAKDFMDLWQKQVQSVVSDKQFIHAMLELLRSMQNPETYGQKQKPSTAAHPADASDALHGDLAGLAFRIGQCEKRLASLEARPKPKGTAKSSKRGSKKPRK